MTSRDVVIAEARLTARAWHAGGGRKLQEALARLNRAVRELDKIEKPKTTGTRRPATITKPRSLTLYEESLAKKGHCMSDDDGFCDWPKCPQIRDGEPAKSGRHCPRDKPRPNAAGET